MAIDQQLTRPLEGPGFRLRSVTPEDVRLLFEIATSPDNLVRWRHRGTTPSWDAFAQGLWAGVQCQFIVEGRDGKPLGLVSAYDTDHRSGHAWLAVLMSEAAPAGLGILAAVRFLDYLFHTFAFRWVYMEALEFNYASFETGKQTLFTEIARLPEHEFHGGRYWDRIYTRVSRDEFETVRTVFSWLGR